MKKILYVLLSMMLVLGMSSCKGSINDSIEESESEEVLNLIGNWVQEGENRDSFQAGYVANGKIEIFWMMDGGDSNALYWSGSYIDPESELNEYSWDSVNDTTLTSKALLASSDETKTFHYKDGKLSYEVSAMGVTSTIELVPTNTDYMSLSVVSDVPTESDFLDITFTSQDYFVENNDGYIRIFYILALKNPNEDFAIQYPQISITAKDEAGKILKTETMTLSGIAAGDECLYTNYIRYEGAEPSSVDFGIETDDKFFRPQTDSSIIYSKDLIISNQSSNFNSTGINFTGEIHNNSNIDLDNAAIMVFYISGESGGTDITYIDNLSYGESKPFEISVYSDLKSLDEYYIWAIQW